MASKTAEQYAADLRADRIVWIPVPARLIPELVCIAGITQWWDHEIGIDKIMKVYVTVSDREITIEGPRCIGSYEPERPVLVR